MTKAVLWVLVRIGEWVKRKEYNPTIYLHIDNQKEIPLSLFSAEKQPDGSTHYQRKLNGEAYPSFVIFSK